MFKALAIKELRETLWIAAAALVLHLLLLTSITAEMRLVPWWYMGSDGIPFVGTTFLLYFVVISSSLAVGLGLRQSAWEPACGTDQFLLHRPLSRRQLMGVKLFVGAVLYLACSAVPILIYAWWAATPGTHASPFEWSMTEPAWKVWLAMPVLYLAAFLSGIRPGRWYASRLLPAAAGGVGVALVLFLPWWWFFGLAAVVLLDVVLAFNILFVAGRRDYS